MSYEVQAGRIATWALEAHVVDHCNLRCHQCCTLSPSLPEAFVDPARLERDLSLAARVLSPAIFKLTGGEPSLHPRLDECIEAVRASEISPIISMTTNGLLARSLPARVFQLLDRMTLSLYASVPVPARTLAHIEEQCRAHDVLLTIKPIGIFQDITPASCGDEAHARRVFSSCWLKGRCHTVRDGRFYLCTRPPHLARGLGVDPVAVSGDGVTLQGEPDDVLRRLGRRLESDVPLASCSWCLGATGAWGEHRQRTDEEGTGRADS